MKDWEKKIHEKGEGGPLFTWFSGELATLDILENSLNDFKKEYPKAKNLPIEVFYKMLDICREDIKNEVEKIYNIDFKERVLN